MDFRYHSLEWSSDPLFPGESSASKHRSLDDLINEKCRAGWKLHGMYPESVDGSKYRLLFEVPCPEIAKLADFAGETDPKLSEKKRRAAEALLTDLLAMNEESGLCAWRSEGGGLTVTMSGVSVTVLIDDNGIKVWRSTSTGRAESPVKLRFSTAKGVLEPEASEDRDSNTPLGVLMDAILEAMNQGMAR